MKQKKTLAAILTMMMTVPSGQMYANNLADSLALQEVVVTGSRGATDVRHLPMTVTIVDRATLTAEHQSSVLPTVMREVPGLFITSRSMMGYGVSTGAAGGINLRGITGGAGQLLVLIDGHPQYQGIYGHPIADSYQTLMAERVEVLRGPASVLYGSNAMGGVMNIVTRQAKQNGVNTNIQLGAGSYGTIQTEASNQVRSGKFSSTVSAQYNRTDNHRPRMGFEQYGGYLKLGYDFNEHWNAYVDANITHFNASYPGTEDKPMYDAEQWITRGVVSAALENHYGNTSGALSVYSNFGRHKIDDGTTDPAAPTQRYFRSKDALTGVSLYQSIQLFEGNRVTAGIDYMHIYGNAYYTSKATDRRPRAKSSTRLTSRAVSRIATRLRATSISVRICSHGSPSTQVSVLTITPSQVPNGCRRPVSSSVLLRRARSRRWPARVSATPRCARCISIRPRTPIWNRSVCGTTSCHGNIA